MLRCPNATSCAILIGVTGSSVTANSQYSLTYLAGSAKISSNSAVSRTITREGAYDYFWFTVAVRP